MLKRISCIFLCLALAIGLCSCGSGGARTRVQSQQNTVEDVLKAGIKEAERKASAEVPSGSDAPVLQVPEEEHDSDAQETADSQDSYDDGGFVATGSIDHVASKDGVFDLTQFKGNMLFAEVFNMVAAPGEYVGETVRIAGTMLIVNDPETKKAYNYCFMRDAMGCCSQGFEFELKDGKYPEVDAPFTVEGVFDVYEENESTYIILRDAKIL